MSSRCTRCRWRRSRWACYEVTFKEYDRFVQATGHRRPNDRGWGRGGRPVHQCLVGGRRGVCGVAFSGDR